MSEIRNLNCRHVLILASLTLMIYIIIKYVPKDDSMQMQKLELSMQTKKRELLRTLSRNLTVKFDEQLFQRPSHPVLPTNIKGLTPYEVSVNGIQQLLLNHPGLRHSLSNFNCTTVKYTVLYKLCSHKQNSNSIYDLVAYGGKPYDVDTIQFIEKAIEKYKDAMFLDLGANIGAISFVLLVKGKHVVAIEAMKDNILDLLLGAQVQDVEGIAGNLALFHGGVSGKPEVLVPFNDGNTIMTRYFPANMSLSLQMEKGRNFHLDVTDPIFTTTVLEILNAIPGKRTIVMKVDIEASECLAFADDAPLRDPNKFIPYIVMEFVAMTLYESMKLPICTTAMVDKVIDNFYKNGYEMYDLGGKKFDARGKARPPWQVIWIHKNAIKMF